MRKLHKYLGSLEACSEALQWVGNKTAKEAWNKCENPSWMLWAAARTEVNSKADFVRVTCQCARLSLKHVQKGEDRPRLAIEAAERWIENPTEENRAAAGAARADRAAAVNKECCSIIRREMKLPWTEEMKS